MQREIFMAPVVEAADMPFEVSEYCVDREFSTHYNNDLAMIEDDGNPLAEWLKERGVKLDKKYNYVGIIAT